MSISFSGIRTQHNLGEFLTVSVLTARLMFEPQKYGSKLAKVEKSLSSTMYKYQSSVMTGMAVPLLLVAPFAPVFSSQQTPAAQVATASVAVVQQTDIFDNSFALKGINIGNDQSSTPLTPYKQAQNEADLALLKGKVSRVRIALAYGLDANDVRNLKQLAIEAKRQGFFVQFGITAGADTDVNTYYNHWLTQDIIATARWAQENHIDEFAIGNEEDWYCKQGAFTAKTPADIRNDVRNKASEVRKVYSGSIVYADAEGMLDDWAKEGIGGLDRIYFNVYDTDSNFKEIVYKIATTFGPNHGGIAEWVAMNTYSTLMSDGMTPNQYVEDMMYRESIIRRNGLPAYLFTLRQSQDGSGWGFILSDGTKRPGLDEFLNS